MISAHGGSAIASLGKGLKCRHRHTSSCQVDSGPYGIWSPMPCGIPLCRGATIHELERKQNDIGISAAACRSERDRSNEARPGAAWRSNDDEQRRILCIAMLPDSIQTMQALSAFVLRWRTGCRACRAQARVNAPGQLTPLLIFVDVDLIDSDTTSRLLPHIHQRQQSPPLL